MGRTETVSDLQMELKAALVNLGHKTAFDLLLKEAWNPEIVAMGNSTFPIVLDKLNIMSTTYAKRKKEKIGVMFCCVAT